MNSIVEIVKAVENGETVFVAEKGTNNWRVLNFSSNGFYLNFKKFDYKIK